MEELNGIEWQLLCQPASPSSSIILGVSRRDSRRQPAGCAISVEGGKNEAGRAECCCWSANEAPACASPLVHRRTGRLVEGAAPGVLCAVRILSTCVMPQWHREREPESDWRFVCAFVRAGGEATLDRLLSEPEESERERARARERARERERAKERKQSWKRSIKGAAFGVCALQRSRGGRRIEQSFSSANFAR